MKKLNSTFSAAAIIILAAGCISHPETLSSVGPSQESASNLSLGNNGRLQIYTATETRAEELATSRYPGNSHPHSSYEIQNQDGATIKYVANSASSMDEAPDMVKLPGGNYTVLAQSSSAGLVSLPVVIEPGKTTVVHLDGN